MTRSMPRPAYRRLQPIGVANSNSIERQMRGARDMARSQQGCIVQAYIDNGVSGRCPLGPEFRRALADADRNVLDVLFVEDAARNSREQG